jgi:hypothetical protein
MERRIRCKWGMSIVLARRVLFCWGISNRKVISNHADVFYKGTLRTSHVLWSLPAHMSTNRLGPTFGDWCVSLASLGLGYVGFCRTAQHRQ